MKRSGSLYPDIVSFGNLLEASRRARKGKRHRPDVAAFHYDLEHNLLCLRDELRSGTYLSGAYRSFWITDPKKRLISAAPYRDRVVHHAVCNVIEPIFDRSFTGDSFANRKGKGSHRALNRCTEFCRRFAEGYVLKCDVSGYFPSMDHDILKKRVAHTLKCTQTLELINILIDASDDAVRSPDYFPGDTLFTPHERRIGIPIGNLTSQLFGNVYLNGFDHWMKETVRCSGYIRFVDDFLVFSNDRSRLHENLAQVRSFMADIRLQLHPRKCQITPVRCGVEFLGWRVFPDHRLVRRSTGVRFQRRLRTLAEGYHTGEISRAEVTACLSSWIGHLKHGDTWGLRARLLEQTSFARGED